MSQKDKKEKIYKQEEELAEIKNKYLRTLAELENFRKRTQKEKTQALSFAIENTIAEFLPLIDNFEKALNFANESSDEIKNWAMGFQMILSQLKDILHNHGIVAFHSIGNIFDPHYHEAMEVIETKDHPEGSIIEEFAKGYKSANRIIRPAKVKITKQISEKFNKEEKEEINDVFQENNEQKQKKPNDTYQKKENTFIEGEDAKFNK